MRRTQRPILPRFLRCARRRLLRLLRRPQAQVVYHERYNASFPCLPNDPLRAERILAFLASEGLVLPRAIHHPLPAALKDLEQIHGANYLDSIHEPAALSRIMGAEITQDQVDRLLDQQRLYVGGTALAVRLALADSGVALHLGGGLHHARPTVGEGFCIFNDIAYALHQARQQGFTGPVLVVDLDVHDGNGTRELFAADPTVHTFSIHAQPWGDPEGAVANTSIALGAGVEDAAYLEALRQALPPVVADFAPQLVIYLAGCDPAADDPLSDWQITHQGMLDRDRFVLAQVRPRHSRRPLAVLLAGGYGSEAWRYSARFFSEILDGRPIEPPSTEEITFKRYRYITGLLSSSELGDAADHDFGLTDKDLVLPHWGAMPETRFLGTYTKHGIELVLERTGLLDRLRDRGYSHPDLEIDPDDPAGETLRLFGSPRREPVLVELRVHRDRRTSKGFDLLAIDWLLTQDPRAAFGPGREQQPGQSHPSLGMLNDIVALLVLACERQHLDGLVFTPSQLHLAVQWQRYGFFVQPEEAARFDALLDLFENATPATIKEALEDGRVIDQAAGSPFRWQPQPMIFPVSERLKSHLEESRTTARTAAGGDVSLRLVEQGLNEAVPS